MRGTNYLQRYEKHYRRTFGEAAVKYLREFKGKSVRRQAYALRTVAPYLEDELLGNVDNDLMATFKEERSKGIGHCASYKPAMAGTINKELNTVTTVLRRACKVWRWIPEPPLIERVVGPEKKSYPYTWEEQEELFSNFDRWAYGAAMFAVNTGVRKAELRSLKWKALQEISSLDTYIFILRGEETKNGKDRAVICNSLARKYVDEQRDNRSKFVFPKMIGLENKAWRDAWWKANLPSDPLIRKGEHNCRHTFGYRLRAFGVWQEDRDELLGHHNSNITQHYAQPDLARLVEATESVAEGYRDKKEIVMLRSV